jgi:hypothetical protein
MATASPPRAGTVVGHECYRRNVLAATGVDETCWTGPPGSACSWSGSLLGEPQGGAASGRDARGGPAGRCCDAARAGNADALLGNGGRSQCHQGIGQDRCSLWPPTRVRRDGVVARRRRPHFVAGRALSHPSPGGAGADPGAVRQPGGIDVAGLGAVLGRGNRCGCWRLSGARNEPAGCRELGAQRVAAPASPR